MSTNIPSSPATTSAPAPGFTPYQKFVVAILAFLQFTVVLDFMVLSPLGAILMPVLHIEPAKFGLVVSVYAISAGVSGILAAGFADRYDRKNFLLFFYAGFLLGTLLCGVVTSYPALLVARVVTGVFGGVVSAASFAIVADVFALRLRGRVMGLIMTAFGASQMLGLPIGIFLAARFGWHAPFLMIAGVSTAVGVVIWMKMQPVVAHLEAARGQHPLQHLLKTASSPRYRVGFLATMLLATGGFMLMPFASAFTVNNQHIAIDRLPILYAITGVCSMILGPVIGRLSDRLGKFRTFCYASGTAIAVMLYYTNLSDAPLWEMTLISVVLFATISGRMASAGALTSAVPAPPDRGAYMSISSSLQQLAGGIASFLAGLIVYQAPSGRIEHYSRLGLVVSGSTLIAIWLMYRVHRLVAASASENPSAHLPAAA